MKTIPLSRATDEIEHALGIVIAALTPDAVADALGLWGSERWLPLVLSPTEPDIDVWRRVHPFPALGSRFLIITDLSFIDERGAFELVDSELEDFVGSYEKRFGETFFNGDVLVVALDAGKVWLLHHEGLHITAGIEPGALID
jgi:hypothetical protein